MTSTDKIEDNITVSNSTIPVPDNSEFHEHSHACDDPTHNHDIPSFFDQNDLFSSLAGAKTEAPAKRKPKKKPQQGTIRAEAIPGHRGDQNIDDLMSFINGPSTTNDKKQKKKSTTTTITTTN